MVSSHSCFNRGIRLQEVGDYEQRRKASQGGRSLIGTLKEREFGHLGETIRHVILSEAKNLALDVARRSATEEVSQLLRDDDPLELAPIGKEEAGSWKHINVCIVASKCSSLYITVTGRGEFEPRDSSERDSSLRCAPPRMTYKKRSLTAVR